jgi:hypothetical protein
MLPSMARFGSAERHPEFSRWLLLLGLTWLGGYVACTTNHDSLARRAPEGASGAGSGGGGAAGFAGSSFGNAGNQPQGGRDNPDDEPPGDNVLTIVNGVVDASSVSLCFARLDDKDRSVLVGSPSPELGYGASIVLTELEGVSLVDDTLQAWVIAGELSRLGDLDCQQAVELAGTEEASVTPESGLEGAAGAGGASAESGAGSGGASEAGAGGAGEPEIPLEKPVLRARSLAVLPPGSIDIGRSMLMVLTGCMGGAAYGDRVDRSACGSSYATGRPTLQPIVVKLSRELGFDKVGLQAVHASLPTATLDIRATGKDAVALVFASSVGFGSIEPRPADTRFTKVELGVDRSDYGLQAVDESGNVAFQEGWPAILERSGIAAIESARTYTVVFLGPRPQLLGTGFWNDNAFAIVDNDPTRE